MKIGYSTIMHGPRIEAGLNMNEYAVLDMVYRLSTSPRASVKGWCNMKKETIAEFLGISRKTVTRICGNLEDLGFLAKSENGTLTKTTDKWLNVIEGQSVPPRDKMSHTEGQNVPPPRDKMSHAIYKDDNNIDNNRERDIRALDFLKTNSPSRFEQEFLMRFKSKIKDHKKFEQDFNDTIDQEELPFKSTVLFARLGKYARNWERNQDKYSPKEEETVKQQYTKNAI